MVEYRPVDSDDIASLWAVLPPLERQVLAIATVLWLRDARGLDAAAWVSIEELENVLRDEEGRPLAQSDQKVINEAIQELGRTCVVSRRLERTRQIEGPVLELDGVRWDPTQGATAWHLLPGPLIRNQLTPFS